MDQQSANKRSLKAYHRVLTLLPQKEIKLANFGSGSVFDFEKILINYSRYIKVTAIDVFNEPIAIPHNLSYIQADLTKHLSIGNFDVITFFEFLEHVDETDIVLRNIKNNLNRNGILIFSIPNLASIYSRIELLFGFQPHILEVSNESSLFGTGIMGRLNSPTGEAIHHIRGITFRAMKEMLAFHGFELLDYWGFDHRIGNLPKIFTSLSPCCYFYCKLLD